jgi:hypothetical protein
MNRCISDAYFFMEFSCGCFLDMERFLSYRGIRVETQTESKNESALGADDEISVHHTETQSVKNNHLRSIIRAKTPNDF